MLNNYVPSGLWNRNRLVCALIDSPVLCQRTQVFNAGCCFIVGSAVMNPTVHTLADNPKRLYAYQFSFLLICRRWSWVCDALCNWVRLGTWLRWLQLTVWFMVYFRGCIECPRFVFGGQLRGNSLISFPRPSTPPRHERLSFRYASWVAVFRGRY